MCSIQDCSQKAVVTARYYQRPPYFRLCNDCFDYLSSQSEMEAIWDSEFVG